MARRKTFLESQIESDASVAAVGKREIDGGPGGGDAYAYFPQHVVELASLKPLNTLNTRREERVLLKPVFQWQYINNTRHGGSCCQ